MVSLTVVRYSLPVKLEYTFEAPQDVDYFVYKPRGSGDNGNWKKFDLYVSTAQKENYEKIASYDLLVVLLRRR